MNDREAFLAEIRRTGEPMAILMYADWLEEQGDELCEVLRKCESQSHEDDVLDAMEKLSETETLWLGLNCAERLLPRCREPRSWSGALLAARQVCLGERYQVEYEREFQPMPFADVAFRPNTAGWYAENSIASALQLTTQFTNFAVDHASMAASFESDREEYREANHEYGWQTNHAIKILHLGLIPLTEAERMEYA